MRTLTVILTLQLTVPACVFSAGESGRGGRSYGCAESSAQSLCTPSNTCGSASQPCQIDVKRTASSASITPGIQGAKSNAAFCVAAGTTVIWQTSNKNTGFTIDFGPTSPFESTGAILGGSDRSMSVAAKKPGCYRFSIGACNTDAIYGMCAEGSAEVIVSGSH
jgi:hypothetical protein